MCIRDSSYTDEMMMSKYSKYGPAPRNPSCMQRSYLLSIDFKVTSVTEWAAQLKINPLYAIVSGFEVGDTPGVEMCIRDRCEIELITDRNWTISGDKMQFVLDTNKSRCLKFIISREYFDGLDDILLQLSFNDNRNTICLLYTSRQEQ